MKTSGLLFLAALALLGSAPASFAQEAIELKQRWTPGQRYVQTMKTQHTTKLDKSEQGVVTELETSTTVTPHETAGQLRLAQKITRIHFEMDMAAQKLRYDSNAPGTADSFGLGTAFGGMLDQEVRMVLDANGKIIQFENLDDIAKSLTATSPMAAQTLTSMFGKNALTEAYNQAGLRALPGKPVKPGESWPFKFDMALPQVGLIAMKGTYTYKGTVDHGGVKCAEIVQNAALSVNIDKLGTGASVSPQQAAAMKQLGMKIEGGTRKGTIWFDPALGLARETELSETMTMRMNNPTPGGKPLEIPITQKVTVTLTKVEDAK